jgi:hypothetical protein
VIDPREINPNPFYEGRKNGFLDIGDVMLTWNSFLCSLLRPRNFFTQNPCLDVPPSYSSSPSQVKAGKSGIRGVVDSLSRLAFGGATTKEKGGSEDCGCK